MTEVHAPVVDTARIVTVSRELWPRFQLLAEHAALVLQAVPSGPSQRERYELVQAPLRRPPIGAQLARREMQVLDGISEGLSDPEIAERIGISPDTVRSHVKSILRKLEANGRTNAVMVACRAGLLS